MQDKAGKYVKEIGSNRKIIYDKFTIELNTNCPMVNF